MNITKMSLITALLISSSAMAFDNTKVSGDANLYYQTTDASNGKFFESASSSADISVNLNVSSDLIKTNSITVSAGGGYTLLSSLGLENNLVDTVWGGAHTVNTNDSSRGLKVENAAWINEAWIAATAGKSTVKLGRMELDTPLVFTEKWTIEKNTFEAAVVINQDIPDTTLVAAYIGNGNGTESLGTSTGQGGAGVAAIVNADGTFDTYATNGAYTLGAINNSWKPLNIQAWYYNLVTAATATWFQADLDLATLGAEGLTLGGQYTTISLNDSSAAAAIVGYEVKDTISAKLSYSQVSSKGAAGYNTATKQADSQSKLYTEAWWNYGNNTTAGAKTVNLTIEAPTKVVDLGLYVTSVDHKTASDLLEVTASGSKSFGAFDASLVYIFADVDTAKATNTVQVYLTANF